MTTVTLSGKASGIDSRTKVEHKIDCRIYLTKDSSLLNATIRNTRL